MLKGRDGLVAVRQARSSAVHRKWATAQCAGRFASLVPFVRFFGVCNTLGYGGAKEDSDIDVFVIARRRRLWTVRFLLTAILSVARLRRHATEIRNRVCLSFYVATDALSMAPLSLDPDPSGGTTDVAPDPYLAWWVESVVPLVDRDHTYEKFIVANRPFVERYRKEFQARQLPPIVLFPERSRRASIVAHVLERFLGGRVGNAMEFVLKKMQLRKIARSSVGKRRENPTSVVVSDHVLKFHENDRRTAIREQWLKSLEELGITVENPSLQILTSNF